MPVHNSPCFGDALERIGFTVTAWTQANQVVENIGLQIVLILAGDIVECTEWNDVMDIQSAAKFRLRLTARLAHIAVALTRRPRLTIPVWAIVGLPTAFPHCRLGATHSLRSPSAATLRTTEIACADMPGEAVKESMAMSTLDGYGLCLSRGSAGHVTKHTVIFEVAKMALNGLLAMKAVNDQALPLGQSKTRPTAVNLFVLFELAWLSLYELAALNARHRYARARGGLLTLFTTVKQLTANMTRHALKISAAMGAFDRHSFAAGERITSVATVLWPLPSWAFKRGIAINTYKRGQNKPLLTKGYADKFRGGAGLVSVPDFSRWLIRLSLSLPKYTT